MTKNCPGCGKTGIGSHMTRCPICGASLPSGRTKALTTGSSRPVLRSVSGRNYHLMPTTENRIGSRGCAVLLSDSSIPPHAATLIPVVGGGFSLRDESGVTRLNGFPITTDTTVSDGDRIQIGTVQLVYQGPSAVKTSIVSASPKLPTKPSSPPVLAPKPRHLVAAPFPLKSWPKPPFIEGTVRATDGPHKLEKELGWVQKIAAAMLLGKISHWLAYLPMHYRKELLVWNYRVEEVGSSRQVSVITISKDPTTLIELNDFVAAWGKERDGNLYMEEAYIYNTGAHVKLGK